jgi:DedD protein
VAEIDEAQDFKRRARRRLIGAIALVLFLVIVPPWIMERDPKPTVSGLSVEIPSQDTKKSPPKASGPATRAEDKPARTPESGAKSEDGMSPPASPSDASKSAAADAKEAELAKSRSDAAKAEQADKVTKPDKNDKARPSAPESASSRPTPKEPARETAKESAKESVKDTAKRSEAERAEALLAGGTVSYVVPIGTFTKGEGLKRLQARMSNVGVKSYTEVASANGQTRLRAGPFSSRDAAEKAREKLVGLGLKPGAVVVRK